MDQMSEQEKIDLLMERYLLGDMDRTERVDFEKKLADDPGLAEQLRQEKMLHQIVTLEHRKKLKDRIAQVMDEEKEKQKKPLTRYFIYFSAAAAVILLAVIFLPRFFSSPGAEELYAEHYSPLENMVTTMSGSAPIATELNRAMTLYDKGDFENAIPLLKQYPDSLPDALLARLYLGVSLLETDHALQAQDVFAGIVDQNHPFYQEHALWYLALAELKLGIPDSSKVSLENLLKNSTSNKYKESAEAILRELE